MGVSVSNNPEVYDRSSALTDVMWEHFKNKRFLEIKFRLLNVIVPEWITLAINNPQECVKLYIERLKAYLS